MAATKTQGSVMVTRAYGVIQDETSRKLLRDSLGKQAPPLPWRGVHGGAEARTVQSVREEVHEFHRSTLRGVQ